MAHIVWGSNYFEVRRPAPAACSSVAQTFWTRRCEVMNCALVRDVFLSEYLTMMRLRGVWEVGLPPLSSW